MAAEIEASVWGDELDALDAELAACPVDEIRQRIRALGNIFNHQTSRFKALFSIFLGNTPFRQ